MHYNEKEEESKQKMMYRALGLESNFLKNE
jgi:hypothetical protein